MSQAVINICPYILAFMIATIITGFELITSQFAGFFFLLRRCAHLYAYCILYGLASVACFGFVRIGVLKGVLQGQSGLTDPWIQAVTVGLFTKALLHARVGTIGGVPIGTETVVHIFEPALLRSIILESHNAQRAYLSTRIEANVDLNGVLEKIRVDVAAFPVNADRITFEQDLRDADTVDKAMSMYLRRFGRSNFERLFPAAT